MDDKGKLIDIFTRRLVGEPQDTQENDKRTSEEGKYIGNISTDLGGKLKTMRSLIDAKEHQARRLINDIMMLSDNYEFYLQQACDILGLDEEDFDREKSELSIDTHGHVWLLPKLDQDKGGEE